MTFILDGELAHRDSGGGESVIHAGGVQWMTAGRGLVHAEVSPESFKRSGGPLEILQLWVNLPSRLKMVPPHYVGLQKSDIPEIIEDDGRVRVNLIAGTWAGVAGPIESLSGVCMTTLFLSPGGSLRAPVAESRAVFLYVVRGQVIVCGIEAEPCHLIELEHDGDEVTIEAASDAVLLFGHAEPLREPVVAHGPFVMNTRDEINEAMRDYQAGRFGGL